jgi:hypothetical protein
MGSKDGNLVIIINPSGFRISHLATCILFTVLYFQTIASQIYLEPWKVKQQIRNQVFRLSVFIVTHMEKDVHRILKIDIDSFLFVCYSLLVLSDVNA